MKKALILVVLIVTPTMAFAQGTVSFINSSAGLVRQWTSPTDSTLISAPVGGAQLELLVAPAGTPFTPLGVLTADGFVPNFTTLAGFLAANPGWETTTTASGLLSTGITPVAGRFNGGTVTLPGIAGGATAEYVIIGWTGAFTSYDAAFVGGAMINSSILATTATGNPNTTPPVTPVALSATFPGFPIAICTGYFSGFTAQPTSQTVVLGATTTFYVGANACPLPDYEWYFNGVSIPGANGGSFQISNAQLANAGTYWVVLSDPLWGVRTSASATLTVLEPPSITHSPQSQTAYAGSTVDFPAGAIGSAPLVYQWFFNGSTIGGAGSSELQLTSVSATQAGTYMVVVTNVAGAVTSAPAMLSVVPPVERRMVPGLVLVGQAGSVLNLESADTLGLSPGWVAFDSVRLTNSSQWYFDVATPLPAQRFYRAWQTGGSSVVPALDLKGIPALTLTGSAGSSVRADYINQFGPTDAWVALDTVTLTNTSRLYFDVSALGQPPRLYRLVQVP